MTKRARAFQRSANLEADKPLRRNDLVKATLAIWNEYGKRLSSGHEGDYHLTKNENAKNFLRREIYALGIHLQRWPWRDGQLADFVKEVRVNKTTRPEKLGGIFHDLLMTVYDDDSQISRQERHLMARELEYARRHQIDPELLCGFLYQSGPRAEIARKLKNGHIEPAFRQGLQVQNDINPHS